MKKDGIQNTNGELAWIRGRKKKKKMSSKCNQVGKWR